MCWSRETKKRQGGKGGKAVTIEKSNKKRAIKWKKSNLPVEAAAIGAGDGQVLGVVVFHCCWRVCKYVWVVVGNEACGIVVVSCGEIEESVVSVECRLSVSGGEVLREGVSKNMSEGGMDVKLFVE